MDTWALKREAQIPKWQERIQACRSSGQAVEKWCRDHGLSSKTYYRWEKYCIQIADGTLNPSDSFYVDQHKRLIEMLGLGECTGLGLKFIKTSQRFYFFMIQPKHNEIIPVAVRKMLANGWSDCFEVVG